MVIGTSLGFAGLWAQTRAVLALILCTGYLCAALPVEARDLGVLGPLHPISEPDMVEDITAMLKEKEASGELARIEAEGKRRALERIQTPQPVQGLRRVQVPRTWHFDPSVRFEEALLDDKGRVIVPAGTLVNPLDTVSLGSTWFLFDGRDPAQVALARTEVANTRGALRLILVGGSPLRLAREWKRPVYFDQGGRAVQRLGLTAVPARVLQDGRFLRIEEVPPL